jgi:asparagine synthase (glutamine-hydrolysing)
VCGIGGCVLAPGRAPEAQVLDRMAVALAHRGPDDRGVHIEESVGLVHTRLAIVDPSPAGHQPMARRAGRWRLTYNGEVFNHAELRRELPGAAYNGTSDTETLLHALERWGEAAIARCNGLFAYAALDVRDRRLLLVRDRFGVKPLYYARHDGGIWFASEIRALLAAGIPRRARPDVLGHAVAAGWANGPLTPIDGVIRVLPGSVVSVDLDTLETSERRWYEPAMVVDRERMATLAGRRRAELAGTVESELQASVRRRLMSDVPLGTMCSGGIDSGLITAFAAAEQGPITAFNASISDQPEFDEGPWGELVAHALGAELHTVRMTASSWRADLVDVVAHNEYPLNHASAVPMAQIAALARENGVKVLLSGEGADELFGGYGWRHVREQAAFRKRGRLGRRAWDAARTAARRAIGGGVPLEGGGLSPEVERFERAVAARAQRAYGTGRSARRRLEAALAGDLSLYLPHLLNRQDKTTMRRSVETRVPFLDPDLVTLALNLPLEARVEPTRKAILRELAERHLPAGVATRPKVAFDLDPERYLEGAVRREFLSDGMLRDVLGVASEPWRAAVRRAGEYSMRLWTAEIWCRILLAGESAVAVEDELWLEPA